jgi:hypothetical protein
VDSNAVKRLKDRLQAFFESHDIRKVETPRFRVSLAANGGKLPVVLDCPEENVPEDYTKVRVEVDKTAIREAIEAGRVLDFAHLGERGRHLSIR